jgi:hypothetical protein
VLTNINTTPRRSHHSADDIDTQGGRMTSGAIARRHLDAALADANASNIESDILCRSLLGLVVAKYLETRAVSDVQAELRFVAENCDPNTDHIFMRP